MIIMLKVSKELSLMHVMSIEKRRKNREHICRIDRRNLSLASPQMIVRVGPTICSCLYISIESANVQEKCSGIMWCESCHFKEAANDYKKCIGKLQYETFIYFTKLITTASNQQRKCSYLRLSNIALAVIFESARLEKESYVWVVQSAPVFSTFECRRNFAKFASLYGFPFS